METATATKLNDTRRQIKAANKLYVNLTRDCFSIQGRYNKGWKVINHTDYCILTNFSTRVSETTRLRVIAEKKKYVHAFLLGNVEYLTPRYQQVIGTVSYNPFKAGHFTLKFQGAANTVNFQDWVNQHGADGYALVATYSVKPSIKLVKAVW